MFTETELRDALEHSAERADDATVRVTNIASRRMTRIALPAVAAAAVVGVVATAAIVASGSSSTPSQQQSAAAPPASRPAATDPAKHVPVEVSVSDFVTVHNPYAQYDINDTRQANNNVEYISEADRNHDGPELVVLPKSAGFDPKTRFTDVQRVDVDGVSAYYGSVVLHPADGKPSQDTDKHGGAQRALGLRRPDGTWLFVVSSNFTPTNRAGLISAYKKMDVVVHSGAVKVPFRTGFVPAGMRLDTMALSGRSPVSDIGLAAGSKSIDVNISVGKVSQANNDSPYAPARDSGGNVAPTASGFAAKQVGEYVIQVSGSYDQATIQKVLNTMQLGNFASDKAWWTIPKAFG